MKRVVVALKGAATIKAPSPELTAAAADQPGVAMIYNGATGNIFVSQTLGERQKSATTLVSELAAYEAAAAPAASPYSVGAWYYPGWMSGDTLSYYQPEPWAWIRPYADRAPLMGEYRDDDQAAIDHHIRVAKAYGLDWFGVVWFAQGVDGSDTISIPAKPAAALACMLTSTEAGAPFKVSVCWDMQITGSIDKDTGANATSARFLARFDAACTQLATLIQANSTKWLTRGGKYVFTIRGEYWTTNFVARSGLSSAALLTRMRNTIAAASAAITSAGLHVAYWGTASGDRVRAQAQGSGFDSWTSYGYVSSILNKDGTPSAGPSPSNYQGLSDVFWTENNWLINGSANAANTIRYTLPLCGGWDAGPWSGLVIGRPTPEQFAAHLTQQKALLDAMPAGEKWAVVCTWNEHGEGSFICPTAKAGYGLLQKIRDVLKP